MASDALVLDCPGGLSLRRKPQRRYQVERLARFVQVTDKINDIVGRSVAWLTLAMVITACAVVVLRYAFSLGWVGLQEAYVWMHGIIFMLGAAYTLRHNGHVRVDILYRAAGERYRACVDLFGSLFLLLPLISVLAYVALPYVVASWTKWETSREAGGLPGLFLLKTVILVFCFLMALQALSLAGRAVLLLKHHSSGATPGHAEHRS
jgi:TRAP-type mannitol/chloroaromatic compound transport system permease small subunit